MGHTRRGRHRRDYCGRPQGEGADPGCAGTSGQFGDSVSWLWPPVARACGLGRGIQCAYSIRTSDAPFYTTGSIAKVDGKWGIAITKSHYQDHRSKQAGGKGDGNYSLEMNEAESAASFARRRSRSTRPIPILPTRTTKSIRFRTPRLRCSRTGSTRTMPGACRSI
jgi:hypothetical protein